VAHALLRAASALLPTPLSKREEHEMKTAMKTKDKLPFLDLVTPHLELKEELCANFEKALEKGAFVGGPAVEEFERDFATFCDVEHCVGVGSGTDALRFAIMAAGLKRDSIVITVPNTFIATAEAISQAGCLVDFVDIDERTFNMDPERLREYLEVECYYDPSSRELVNKKLSRPVGAIVPVHLYGQTANMDPILELADRYGLPVIEDACQAHGAEYFSKKDGCWKKAGSMGLAGAFSFYPGKNLGACGEGGAVTTNDPDLAKKIRMLRDHGQSQKYFHEMEGFNGRLDAIQAGILQVKLRHLSSWNESRRQAASRYWDLFMAADGGGDLPPYEPNWANGVYHLYVIRVKDRTGLIQHLGKENIGTGIHYPVPLHLQNAYKSLGYNEGDFPVSEKASSEIVSLPMFPHLKYEQQMRIVDAVHRFALDSEMKFLGQEVEHAIATGVTNA
jgi:dTDP-4-amino-4,6-dideoxygalactose transaminase